MTSDSLETAQLLQRAGQGDPQALGDLFVRHQDRLRRMVQLRMDQRLQGRIDPSDVLQETYFELVRCLAEYLRNPPLPFFLWLRLLTGKKLQALHRHHLGTRMRDAGREIALDRAGPQASSASLAAQLLGGVTTPSQAAMLAELQVQVQEALNRMDAIDREVLVLRHFEQLTNAETAQVLGIGETAASNRFVRALKRFKDLLTSAPGFQQPTGLLGGPPS
jgi:RNA polymerase sigma-70 factor (ECF subfamily)